MGTPPVIGVYTLGIPTLLTFLCIYTVQCTTHACIVHMLPYVLYSFTCTHTHIHTLSLSHTHTQHTRMMIFFFTSSTPHLSCSSFRVSWQQLTPSLSSSRGTLTSSRASLPSPSAFEWLVEVTEVLPSSRYRRSWLVLPPSYVL